MPRRLHSIGIVMGAALVTLFALLPPVGAAPSIVGTENVRAGEFQFDPQMLVVNAVVRKLSTQTLIAGLDVSDQPIVDGTITVASVTASQDGWVAVHKDEGGRPGKVIGFTLVKQGEAKNVKIELTEDTPVGGTLWPMLHIDAGTIGVYEFPGPDAPVIVNGDFLVKRMTVTAVEPLAGASWPGTVTVTVGLVLGALALLVGAVLLVLRRMRRPKIKRIEE